MTGYHITLGYNAINTNYAAQWRTLKKLTRVVADNPKAIITEARRLGSPETCERGCCHLDSYANNYAEPFDSIGHPISIIEEDVDKQIMQLASTDDPIKYHVRRAYIRLLIEQCHKREIEVNLTVT